ncbi:hypothetical protein BpHYR1_026203 [Brachionus plicatilis]|uniref:Uncharacterized protein n=1 Tax=Brachionus plicatilis TaxID=10195 RepID=A0A3M7R094_BRAPC|nr:hypothetical protein BpHYR1_026203 [Brachionus plicatilis]
MTKINSSKEEALRIRVYGKEARIWSNTEKNDLSTTQQAKKAFDHKDNISQRQVAKKFDISQQMVSKLLKKLQITPRKKMKIPDRTETQKKGVLPNISMNFIFFSIPKNMTPCKKKKAFNKVKNPSFFDSISRLSNVQKNIFKANPKTVA